MATRSPTHAFDPTPALEHDPDNYSPLTYDHAMESSVDFKGVRFSDPPSLPIQARHSIATSTVPLLPPVSSASQLPGSRQFHHIPNPIPGVEITRYMEQCRLVNAQLREARDNDGKAHNSERIAWDIERSALKARIDELEKKLNKGKDTKRRLSNDSSSAGLHSFRSNSLPVTNGSVRQRISPEPTISEQPVWIGPEAVPPATRVFSHEDDHLPSISEDAVMPSLSKEISPTTQESVPVPVEQVDKTLDGITLRSTALTSSFDKEMTSPQFASPARSPSPLPKKDDLLKIHFNSLLSPLDEKLKRHAGHTPMAFDSFLSSEGASTTLTPRQEQPVEPAPTKRPSIRPSENSDSYFSFTSAGESDRKENHMEELQPVHETDNDPALKGPLMLDPNAKTAASATFLNDLDAKLKVEQEHQERTERKLSGVNGHSAADQPKSSATNDEEMPRLRMKNSMNFGSAWGEGLVHGRA